MGISKTNKQFKFLLKATVKWEIRTLKLSLISTVRKVYYFLQKLHENGHQQIYAKLNA